MNAYFIVLSNLTQNNSLKTINKELYYQELVIEKFEKSAKLTTPAYLNNTSL